MDSVRRSLLMTTGALVAFGLVMVYSASFVVAERRFGSPTYFLERHAIYLLAGCFALAVTSLFDYHRLARYWKWFLAIAFVLLAVVLIPGVGTKLNGARRWFSLGGLTFQPSELVKPLLIVGLAGWAVHVRERIETFSEGFLPGALLAGAAVVLTALEPDLGSAGLLAVVSGAMLFTAGVKLRHGLPVALILLPAGAGFAYFKLGYIQRRVGEWWNGISDPTGAGYQIDQALKALGSGGVHGVGLGQGQSKLFFLPEAHNDFIFALLGEEFGLIGTLALLLLFVLFVVQGWRVASRAPDKLGALIALGVTLCIGFQAAINMAVVTHSMPTKGIALPLVSYGGSSLVFTLAAIGLLLNVAAHPSSDALPSTLGALPVAPAATGARTGLIGLRSAREYRREKALRKHFCTLRKNPPPVDTYRQPANGARWGCGLMRLVIAGGGTGGHLFPGLALAEELLSRPGDQAVLFMGARGGIEERIVPQHAYRLELLPSLKGGFFHLDGPRKAWMGVRGYFHARRAIQNFKADAVVGMGGYASALPVAAAWGLEVPCMLMEQNVIPGRTSRLLAGFADEIGLQFPEAGRFFKNAALCRHVGNPLRRKVQILAAEAVERNTALRETPAEPTVLVLGGSQGARAVNDIAIKVWPKLKQIIPGVKMILVSGRDDESRAVAGFAAAGGRGQVLGFTESMEELYAQADVVLARAGATSIAETCAFALPSVLIPYPHAADNHQLENAKVFVARGAGWVMHQKNIEIDRLAQRLADAVLQPERRRKMAQAAYSLAKPRAAAETIDRLFAMAGANSSEATDKPENPGGPNGGGSGVHAAPQQQLADVA
jgi:cell division protein FtsW